MTMRDESPRLTATCGCPGSRRGFLSGLAALAAGPMVASCATPASPPTQDRIDVHHHMFSPAYVSELAKVNQAPPIVRNWSVARTLEDMDRAGVRTSVVSVTTPQVSFVDGPQAARIARESNEWAARLRTEYPGRFGFFAMLPMQQMDATLRELEYALDTLKADGVGLLTSYGDKWLGHAQFAPLMDELNRRKAICYTHPTAANCCRNVLADIPPTVIEYGTDTTRTITDLVFSGTAARCPDIRFIFSHAGGTLPFLVERLVKVPVIDPRMAARVPRGVLTELRRFYYDTAWAYHPGALASLTKLVDVDQILLGSDFPYVSGPETVRSLLGYGFTPSQLRAIERGNALRLLPHLAA